MKRYYWFALSLLLLNSCSLLFPAKPVRIQQYVLTPPVVAHSPRPTQAILGVNTITAPVWLATTQMAYQLQPNTLNYFAVNQWIATPTQLLQPIVMQVLQQSGIYRAVIALPTTVKVNQQLNLRLLQMQQQFWLPTSQYQVSLQATLTHDNTLIATRYFTITLPVQPATPGSGALVANQAIAQLMPQLVDFCRRHVA